VVEDSDYARRLDLFDRLGELREAHSKQKLANSKALLFSFDSEVIKKIHKLSNLWSGLFLQLEHASVGLCGELADLALIKICQSEIDKANTVVELIMLDYTDDDNKEDDNHIFLAIN